MPPPAPTPADASASVPGNGVVPSLAELVALREVARARHPARRGRHGASGQAPSPQRGRGMEYAESREYARGDDARHVDWRLTARSGRLHTKLFQAERERLTLLVADTAPALYFGTRVRFKSVQAARAGAVAAWAAVADGDRVAALRGHSVTLYEASDRFGGMMRTAAKSPGWSRLDLLADWLVEECRHEGVKLVAEHPVDADALPSGAHVIVATGGRPGTASYDVAAPSMLRHATEVLDDPSVLPEGEVLIWDPIGGPIGVGLAELLVAQGRQVHLATQDNIVGNELARSGDLAPANSRLQQAGVELHRRSILRSVQQGSATFEDRFSGERRELDVAVVVDAGHRLPDERLWHELAEVDGLHVQRVGDCVAPRTVYDAILEGRRAAIALG